MHNLELSNWGLPDGVLEYYKKKGIVRMFPWQLECLSAEKVLEGENLVYSAPTSAGKTLVAEILVAQNIFDRKKKALIILPFVSVVREKMFYFQNMFSSNGIRVEGYMGGHTPSASFQQVSLGVCTIEKANSLINRMLEEKTLATLGIVVVDELHMLGDPYRGYLLELLLTKLLYMATVLKDLKLQIVGMSATLPNLNMLAKWLKARLYYTDFRPIPLKERLKCGKELFNSKLEKVDELSQLEIDSSDDSEDVGHICIETLRHGHSVLIFCPTKVWCESLSLKLAVLFRKLGCSESATKEGSAGWILRQQLDLNKISEVVSHLKLSAVGLDQDLEKTVPYGVAFHHAGLTLDERDIIEGSFRNGSLRVVCATSTLSSGVNLPARRVIIRSPMSHGGVMDILTYRQMIGRAGRMGKDTEGESILICKPNEKQSCRQLMSGVLKPIESCLGSGRLSASLKRAILEIVASGIASTPEQVSCYASSTFLASCSRGGLDDPLTSCLGFLVENELIRLQAGGTYAPTPLGQACLASSLPPDEGLALFRELERARRCFVLDSDLHIIYQVTPYSVSEQWSKIDWLRVLNMLEELSPSMRRVADLVGIQDSFLVKVVKGSVNLTLPEQRNKLCIHRRFYTALALQDLVNEVPLPEVARKFDCSKGLLQSLQQSAATYAGMVSEFAKRLRWGTIEAIVSQFHERLQFGVQKELCELMRLSSLNGVRARTLFNAGFTTLSDIANSDVEALEASLLAATPFQTKMQIDGETGYEHQNRTRFNTVWVTGKTGLSIREAAGDLIKEARNLLEMELGVVAVWSERSETLPLVAASIAATLSKPAENYILQDSVSAGVSRGVSTNGSAPSNSKNELVRRNEGENDDFRCGANNVGHCGSAGGACVSEEIDPIIVESEKVKDEDYAVRNGSNNLCDEKDKGIGELSRVNSPESVEYGMVTQTCSKDTKDCCNCKLSSKCKFFKAPESKVTKAIEDTVVQDDAFHLSSICDWNVSKIGRDAIINGKPPLEKKTEGTKISAGNACKNADTEELKNFCDRITSNGTPSCDILLSTVCDWDIQKFERSLSVEDKELNRIATERNISFTGSPVYNKEVIGARKELRSTKNYPHSIDYFEASFNPSPFQSPPIHQKNSTPGLATVRSRFSTDLFEESPKPSSTPVSGHKAFVQSVNSPDLFSQSLTFDTQLEQMCDDEETDDTSPALNSEDHGFFSDSSPVIVAEVSVSEHTPRNVSIGASKEAKKVLTPFNISRKRKASPDIIVGSDDSICEENHTSRRLAFLKRQRVKRPKQDTPLIVIDSSEDEDEQIAPTPQATRSLTLTSPQRSTELPRCLSLGSPRRGTQALLNRMRGLGYGECLQKSEDTNGLVVQPIDVEKNVDFEAQKDVQNGRATQEETKKLLSNVNWDTLNFVDVCGNSSVFKSFREELKDQQIIGLALGCQKVEEKKKMGIGANLLNNYCAVNEEGNISTDLVLDGIAFYWNKNNVFYMRMNAEGIGGEEIEAVLKDLNASMRKLRLFDMKEQLKALAHFTGVFIDANFEDPKVASWLTAGTSQDLGLKGIVSEHLSQGLKLADIAGACRGTGSPALSGDSPVTAKTRACIESFLSFHLMEALCPKILANKMGKLFHDIEMPTLRVLVEMEQGGFRFDETRLKSAKTELEGHLAALEQRAHVSAGRKFSMSSYAAVAKVIHSELRLSKGLMDQKKKPGTGKEVLELLSFETKHPLPDIILQWRKVKAIITKVIFPLLQLLPNTRVFGNSQTFTVTGRISMKEPNLQNIPRDFDVILDKNSSMCNIRLRDMFIASEGSILLSADYCQVELRLLACLSKDVDLMQTIRESSDVFVDIAASINKVPRNQVAPEQRQRAKQTCYGIIYGIGMRALSQQLKVPEDVAQALHDQFKSKYQGVQQFLVKTVSDCQKNGYIETLAGRRRYLPAINNNTPALRSEAERQAVNTTVQGSAADLVKTAMVKFRDNCCGHSDIRGRVRLVLHLHDEVIYEVPEALLPVTASLLKTCMENAMALPVPFPVKVKAGHSWGELANIPSFS